MSYTIVQQTAYKEMPVGTDWVYTVYDTQAASKYKFKYIVQVYGGSDATEYLGKFKFSPNALGFGIIKIDEILEQYISSDNLGSIRSAYTSAFKGVNNVLNTECPIHCIDKLSLNTNAANRVKVKFGSEYASFPNISPTEYLGQQTIDDLLDFNGVAYNNEDKFNNSATVNGYGIDLIDWNNSVYVPTGSNSRFLTDANNVSQYIGENDYATLAFLTGKFENIHPQPDSYRIKFYDINGAQTGSTLDTSIISSNGGYDTGLNTGLVDAEFHLQYIGVGVANLKGRGVTIPSDWNKYTIELRSSLLSVTKNYNYYKQDADCKGFEKIRITWLNKYGVWDYYNFTKKTSKSISIKRDNFNKVKGDFNSQYYVKHGYQRGNSTLNNMAIEKMSLNSDWFRDDAEAAWLEQLFISPEVYIINGYDATDTAPAEYGHYMIPVTVTEKTYDRYTEANDKVAQYNIEIEYAIDKRIQRG